MHETIGVECDVDICCERRYLRGLAVRQKNPPTIKNLSDRGRLIKD